MASEHPTGTSEGTEPGHFLPPGALTRSSPQQAPVSLPTPGCAALRRTVSGATPSRRDTSAVECPSTHWSTIRDRNANA
ncbi:hypothetical protein ACFWCB_15965 [Streptomyces sp. NPDC060048]|uniref:hypothetical protein n=1 Tax=unclassified Streptomyces TaxID=2593676 RepID=UPI0036C34E70